MDKQTKELFSKKVTNDITGNLVRRLGGKMDKVSPDAITEQNWVGLSTMLIHIRRNMSTLVDTVLNNKDGGLTYMAMLSVIHDQIMDAAENIEQTLGIKTGWFPAGKIDRAKTGDKAGDYFYTKLRREVETYMEKKIKEQE